MLGDWPDAGLQDSSSPRSGTRHSLASAARHSPCSGAHRSLFSAARQSPHLRILFAQVTRRDVKKIETQANFDEADLSLGDYTYWIC
jgi:hypothetical protein